jgi:hypothetical protein
MERFSTFGSFPDSIIFVVVGGIFATILSFITCYISLSGQGLRIRTYILLIYITIGLHLALGIMAFLRRDAPEKSFERIWTAPSVSATFRVKTIQTTVILH